MFGVVTSACTPTRTRGQPTNACAIHPVLLSCRPCLFEKAPPSSGLPAEQSEKDLRRSLSPVEIFTSEKERHACTPSCCAVALVWGATKLARQTLSRRKINTSEDRPHLEREPSSPSVLGASLPSLCFKATFPSAAWLSEPGIATASPFPPPQPCVVWHRGKDFFPQAAHYRLSVPCVVAVLYTHRTTQQEYHLSLKFWAGKKRKR